MGIKVKGLKGVLAKMARTEKKVLDHSLAALRKQAQLVVMMAKLNAPIDKGDLENAIVAREKRERTALGRFGQVVIEVGVDTSLLDLGIREGFDYSIEMHEGDYNLGPRSQIKQDHLPGVTVGYKYLERALKDSERQIRAQMEQAVRQAVE